MMNNNPLMQQLSMMLQQGGGNPQAYVNELLRKNPQFAQQIQGKNVQQMAEETLRQRGIDPQQFFQSLRGFRR